MSGNVTNKTISNGLNGQIIGLLTPLSLGSICPLSYGVLSSGPSLGISSLITWTLVSNLLMPLGALCLSLFYEAMSLIKS